MLCKMCAFMKEQKILDERKFDSNDFRSDFKGNI